MAIYNLVVDGLGCLETGRTVRTLKEKARLIPNNKTMWIQSKSDRDDCFSSIWVKNPSDKKWRYTGM